MKILNFSVIAMAAGLLVAAPAFAQTTPQKQPTDGSSITTTGPASAASKHRTESDGITTTGPASGASKQRTESDGITTTGPASGASKKH